MTHRKRRPPKSEKETKPEGVILVISDGKAFFGTGLAFEIILRDEKQKSALYGKRVGQTFDGKEIGLPGYTFKITGGTDKFGFMHHPSLDTTELKKVLLTQPPGIRFSRFKKPKKDGGYKYIDLRWIPRKKTVRGGILSEYTRQVNLVVVSRRGQSIKEMSKESILSDRILSQLVEKMGMQVLRNGLYRVRFVQNGEIVRLEDKLKELGITDDFIKKLSVNLGVEIIKKGRGFVEKVIKPVLKVRGDSPFAKYIGKTLYEFYQDLKEGKVNIEDEDAIIGDLTNKLLDGAEKAFNGELKVQFNFKIKESKSA